MNVLKVIVLTLTLVSLTVLAQNSTQNNAQASTKSNSTKSVQTATTQSTVQATTAAKPARAPKPGQNAPDKISADPETVLTLCCGSLDPHSMAGENCAYMHSGQGCGGFILACPKGSSETVKKDGSGYCKQDP